ncbi:MAG: hypothetical protein RIT25_919 [Planctomycetota bacterium]
MSRRDTVIQAGSVSALAHETMGRTALDLASLMSQGLPAPDWQAQGDLVLRDIEQVLREAAARAGRPDATTTEDSGRRKP